MVAAQLSRVPEFRQKLIASHTSMRPVRELASYGAEARLLLVDLARNALDRRSADALFDGGVSASDTAGFGALKVGRVEVVFAGNSDQRK